MKSPCPSTDVDEDVFAKGKEVSTRNYLAERIHKNTRASELIGRCVGYCWNLGKLCRVFGNKFSRRVNKDRSLGIRDPLDAFTFAIVKITADNYAVLFYLGLLVVTIEYKSTRKRTRRIDIANYVAILVIRKTLACSKTICVRINGRRRIARSPCEISSKRQAVSKPIVAPCLAPVYGRARLLNCIR